MKHRACPNALLCSVLILFSLSAVSQTQTSSLSVKDESFKAFLPKWEHAFNRFINGDPSAWKKICSQTEDATIFGGFGGYEKGWKIVDKRYDWASSQFKESGARLNAEVISVVVNNDLAYMTAIERYKPRIGDMKEAILHNLRSTQVFKKENGEWKLIHRHADAFIHKKTPGADTKS